MSNLVVLRLVTAETSPEVDAKGGGYHEAHIVEGGSTCVREALSHDNLEPVSRDLESGPGVARDILGCKFCHDVVRGCANSSLLEFGTCTYKDICNNNRCKHRKM